jgi:hypothetical protein
MLIGIAIQLSEFGVERGIAGRRGLNDDCNNTGFDVEVGVHVIILVSLFFFMLIRP